MVKSAKPAPPSRDEQLEKLIDVLQVVVLRLERMYLALGRLEECLEQIKSIRPDVTP